MHLVEFITLINFPLQQPRLLAPNINLRNFATNMESRSRSWASVGLRNQQIPSRKWSWDCKWCENEAAEKWRTWVGSWNPFSSSIKDSLSPWAAAVPKHPLPITTTFLLAAPFSGPIHISFKNVVSRGTCNSSQTIKDSKIMFCNCCSSGHFFAT